MQVGKMNELTLKFKALLILFIKFTLHFVSILQPAHIFCRADVICSKFDFQHSSK